MKPGGPLKRYTPLRRVSAKREASFPARRACVAAVIERDRVCQYAQAAAKATARAEHRMPDACHGPLTGHEPAGRRNVDPTDPANVLLLCAGHNEAVESFPDDPRLLGLRPPNRAAL